MSMMDLSITPVKLQGNVTIPASKSLCHRAVICAGLARGTSVIGGVSLSDDITATIEGMRAMGTEVRIQAGRVVIAGTGGLQPVETA
ncbi:3-phosphoshikimate 1-carboxyvinyltransferase, partial [Acetonema longum DSM 6540]